MKWVKRINYVAQIDARIYTIIHRNGDRNALGQFVKGGKFSKAVKEAISKGRKWIKFTDEHCENIAKAKIGDKNPAYGKVGFDSYRGRQVMCLDTGEVFGSTLEASRKMRTHPTVIRRNADGLIKKPRKYRWAWVDESEVKYE